MVKVIMKRILFKDILVKIPRETVIFHYITSNKSQKQCADIFGISQGMFCHLLKTYDIHKDTALHVALIKQSKLEKYGNENYNNRDKAKQTCITKYGVDNPFKDVEHIKESWRTTLGVDHPMHRDDIKNRVLQQHDYTSSCAKAKQTWLDKYGVDNPAKLKDVQRKGIETKIQNGVFDSPHSSNIERRLEKILKRRFDVVVSHYRDVRYSRESGYQFECDFYIPSIDLFIELNAHPTHGKHPYNHSNPVDVSRAKVLQESTRSWDNVEYETWVVRDTEKYICAKSNGLNYIVLYPLSSIHENVLFNDSKNSDLIKFLLKKLLNIKG